MSKIHQASGKKWTQWYQDEIMDQSLKKATVSKADDVLKAAKNVIGELDDHVKSLDNAKKDIVKAMSEYDNDSVKKFFWKFIDFSLDFLFTNRID